jgi:hypothetical protein
VPLAAGAASIFNHLPARTTKSSAQGFNSQRCTLRPEATAQLIFASSFGRLALIGCGSHSSNPSNINGTWNATITQRRQCHHIHLWNSLKANGDGSLTVSNFSFTSIDGPARISLFS